MIAPQERELRLGEYMEHLKALALATQGPDDDDWSEMSTDRHKGGDGANVQRLRAVFDAFDADESGTISAAELSQIMKEMRIEKTAEEVH